MGRGKVQIKRIDNISNRQVTFSKRKNGILKKTKEITTLCECQVSLIIFNSSDKLVSNWCSDDTSLESILDLYHKKNEHGVKLWDAKHEKLSKEIDRIKKENDSMQADLKHLKGEDIQSLQPHELYNMEKVIEDGLTKIGKHKMEYHKMLERNVKILEGVNQELYYLQQQREMQNAYPHIPISYRVPPKQADFQGSMH